MARGDPPMPLEQLLPYYRGARFALIAIRQRYPAERSLATDVSNYVAMLQRFEAAITATYRLHRRQKG